MKKIVTIVGRSGSGKTTVVEGLIRLFSREGLSVAAVKSIRHEFQMDTPGKDTFRFREAGAGGVAITSGRSFGAIGDCGPLETPVELGQYLFPGADMLIIEGYKEGPTWKIEVVGDSNEAPLFMSGVQDIRIVVSDRSLDTTLPLYRRNDIDGIAKEIRRVLSDVLDQ